MFFIIRSCLQDILPLRLRHHPTQYLWVFRDPVQSLVHTTTRKIHDNLILINRPSHIEDASMRSLIFGPGAFIKQLELACNEAYTDSR